MTSQACQGTREKAGISKLEGKNRYGTTTTSQNVNFDTNEKGASKTKEDQKYGALVGWDDLLSWQQDNEFISTFYRRATSSYLRSLRSVFQIHNETVNIWSHIVGASVFLCAAVLLYLSAHPDHGIKHGKGGDDRAVYVYLGSVIACFVFSFVFHIFLDHSERVRTWTCRFDYLGIVMPLYGTSIGGTHFTFRCEAAVQDVYNFFDTFAGLACALITLHPSFSGPQSRNLRISLYLLLGLSSFLPVVHGIYAYGVEEMNQRMGLAYYLGLTACQGTGAMLYAARIPERWFPRRCDVLGSSHQIMHVLVVCGAAVYGVGLLGAKKYWETRRCEA